MFTQEQKIGQVALVILFGMVGSVLAEAFLTIDLSCFVSSA